MKDHHGLEEDMDINTTDSIENINYLKEDYESFAKPQEDEDDE
jgi:hypothetical protein